MRAWHDLVKNVRTFAVECSKTTPGKILIGIACVVGLWFIAGTVVPSLVSGTESHLQRRNRASVLAASSKNAVVLVQGPNREVQLLLVDFASMHKARLGIAQSSLSSPYLSPDGQRLLVVRYQLDKTGAELLSCDTIHFRCKSIMKSSATIHSQIELPGDRILYVSSPYHPGRDGGTRTIRNDFWLFDPPTGARRLTDYWFYQLYSISTTQDSVYFNAYGGRLDKPLIPRSDPLAQKGSEIFKLPFVADKAKIVTFSPPTMLKPLFLADGLAIRPKISADGSLFAYLRTAKDRGSYRYDLVVANMNTGGEHSIPSAGTGYSTPVVVGDAVYASDILEKRIIIRKVTQRGRHETIVAEIDDISVGDLKTIELTLAP